MHDRRLRDAWTLAPIAVPLAILLLAAPSSVGGQHSSEPIRSRFGASLGTFVNITGKDACGAGLGLGLGAELRTRGKWLVATSADFFALALAGPCALPGRTVEFQGEQVEVFHYGGITAPRVSVRVGRAIKRADGSVVEPAVGIGSFFLRTDFPGNDDNIWAPWYGASLTLRRPRGFFKALAFEVGWREIPFRYYRYRSTWEMVHEFGRMEPFIRVATGF